VKNKNQETGVNGRDETLDRKTKTEGNNAN